MGVSMGVTGESYRYISSFLNDPEVWAAVVSVLFGLLASTVLRPSRP
jgi:hypothetical protein